MTPPIVPTNRLVRLRLWVILLIVWLLIATGAIAQQATGQQATGQTLEARPRPILLRTSVAGDPLQMGQQAGAQSAPVLPALSKQFVSIAERLKGLKKNALYAEAAKLSIPMDDRHIREMRGIALGAGLTYEDILFLNMFFPLIETRMACRQIAAWDKATGDGALIHGRNLDWLDYEGDPLKKNNLIVNYRPEQRIECVAISWPGLVGVLTGINRQGIAVGFNRLPDGTRAYRHAEPVFMTLRRVLEQCATLGDAIDTIERAKPLGNGSILVSSARERAAAVLELVDGQVGVRRSEGFMICNANHATVESGVKNVRVRPADEPAIAVARELGLPLNAHKVRSILSDSRVLTDSNILSVIFEFEKNRMHLACGVERAAEADFVTQALFPEETPPAPTPVSASAEPAISPILPKLP